jgi:hypothetical protein
MNKLQRILYQVAHRELGELEAERQIEALYSSQYLEGIRVGMKPPKEYECLCARCGHLLFPQADTDKLNGITATKGTCQRCGTKDTFLVPVNDFMYASGEGGGVWD